MDYVSTKPERYAKTRYKSHLLLCIFVSVGTCFGVVHVLPTNSPKEITDSSKDYLELIISRISMAVVAICLETFMIWCVRRRNQFHRDQRVFWPTVCAHCARAVGLQDRDDCAEIPRYVTTNSEGRTAINASCSQGLFTSTESNERRTGDSSHRGRLYRKPHMSLLKTYYVFGTISLLNTPLQLVGVIIYVCLNPSAENTFVVICQGLVDFSYITVVGCSMVFFAYYYEAVFVEEPKFSYPVTITSFACVYTVVGKFILPVADALGNHINDPGSIYKLNGTFGEFLVWHDSVLPPFYSECGLMAAWITWQLWSSIYPRKSFLMNHEYEESRENVVYIPSSWRITSVVNNREHILGNDNVTDRVHSTGSKVWSLNSRGNIWGKLRTWLTKSSHSSERLISQTGRQSLEDNQSHILMRITFILCSLMCVIYFGLSQFVAHYESLTTYTRAYLLWSLEIALMLPLLAVYHYQRFMSDSAKYFYIKANVAIPGSLLGTNGHIILPTCVGIFMFSLFQLVAAVNVLFRSDSGKDGEVLTLSIFATVYSAIRIFVVLEMTIFLLVVQQQNLKTRAEIRWTLVALIMTTSFIATVWLQQNLGISQWPMLSLYYGKTTGHIIGLLLEPIVKLYYIHAAMIAYEAYKELGSQPVPSQGNLPVDVRNTMVTEDLQDDEELGANQ